MTMLDQREIITQGCAWPSKTVRRFGAGVAALMMAGQAAGGFSVQSSPKPFEGEMIVSMGDSIAAGFGNPPYDAGTVGPENQCYRSTQYTAANVLSSHVINLACQGASLNDIVSGTMYNERLSQLDMLKDLNVPIDKIIFSGGINEQSLAEVLNSCLGNIACEIDPTIEENLRSVFRSNWFEGKLQMAYTEITQAAPEATLIVVGYTTPIQDDLICGASSLVRSLNGAIDDLNATIERAVDGLDNDMVIYAKPPDIGLCADTIRGQGGIHLDPTRWTFGHPDGVGQYKIGQAVVSTLKGARREVTDMQHLDYTALSVMGPTELTGISRDR